jgi:hypothetical protein
MTLARWIDAKLLATSEIRLASTAVATYRSGKCAEVFVCRMTAGAPTFVMRILARPPIDGAQATLVAMSCASGAIAARI